ncbi:hypothetical protein GW17_00059303 [Ensete ventricosum]|nr:hypothetical protein GW17_00059303 [Ensete ventricosum]
MLLQPHVLPTSRSHLEGRQRIVIPEMTRGTNRSTPRTWTTEKEPTHAGGLDPHRRALALDSSESAPSGSPAYAASVHESIDGCRGKSWMAQDSSFLLSLRHPGRGGCGAQARGFDCVGGLPSPTPHSGVGGRCLVSSNGTDAVTTKETDPSSSSSSPPVWSTA